MRGSKADLWDGGHRIPFIVRWPGEVEPASQSNQLICLTDLIATCYDLFDQAIPDTRAEDSVSFLPALYSEPIESSRSGVIHHSFTGHFSYRQGNWKLLLAKGSGGWSSPKENEVAEDAPIAQLYNLETDPEESNNLYATHPEIAGMLLSQLKSDITNGRSTAGPNLKNDVDDIILWKSGN